MKDIDLIALAGLLHDIGKFGQRAKLEKDEGNLDLYCPFKKDGGYFTHQHALFTGQIIDEFEKIGLLSKKDLTQKPFKEDDSFINATSMHHKPQTLIQWIIAIADRVSSGFERETFKEYNQSDENKNYIQSRLFVPFAEFSSNDDNIYRYGLQSINANSIKIGKKDEIEPTKNDEASAEYKKLYDNFLKDAKKIKSNNLLEKIDSLLETYTTFIPSATAFGTKPNVSLYDHLKSTSAFAIALYRYHINDFEKDIDINTKEEWKKKKFLIISGDFFGIQKFIFSGSVENSKNLAKSLRGRSAMVSIITELATLKIVQELELASTSVIQNVAGKFMIIADNSSKTKEKLEEVKRTFDNWFLKYTYGESGIGIVYTEASCNDFSHKKLKELQQIIHFKLEDIKSKKFDLINFENPVFTSYLENLKDKEICPSCDTRIQEVDGLCKLCDTYKVLGAKLANSKNDKLYIYKSQNDGLDIFGYSIEYTYNDKPYEIVYDFSLSDDDGYIFNGYPKRTFKAYIPTKSEEAKTFEEIADSSTGKSALAVFKADIDNLGSIFIEKLPNSQKPNFAKYNMVSRLINNFFTINLSYLLKTEFSNIYTIFAGGDDLFLVGAWSEIMNFSKRFKEEFDKYFISEISQMSFSASITMVKQSTPISFQARVSEEQLDEAKKAPNKNSVQIFQNTVNFKDFISLVDKTKDLQEQKEKFKLSTGFIYSLVELSNMRENDHFIENTLWNSKLRYLGYRNIVDKVKKEQKKEAEKLITEIGNDIEKYGKSYEVALFTNLYEERKNAQSKQK
jgi:CRISPR-associated protein Csm1